MTDVVLSCTPSHFTAGATVRDAYFAPPWDALDDAALLAHFRSERGVRCVPVIDPEEIRPERIEGVLHGRFEFNGETHALPDPIDWLVNPSADVEWHILLHKFYYAVGLAQAWRSSGQTRYARRWAELVDGWMRVTPPGFIAADVTGRRVQNWIYSLHVLVLSLPPGMRCPIDGTLLRRVLRSIHEQVEYLCAHLTPKRNHRTLELLAVFLAGVVFPEFARATHWRDFALRETLANIEADLLPDGVHCELSTDYHCLALRNWLQVRTLAADNGVAVPPALDAALQRALDFARHVHQPAGRMPSFSDGDARGYDAVLRQGAALYGETPLRRIAHFDASGYHVLRSDCASPDAQHLVFDCGPLGEGNHGHFDALSFELAAFGVPLVVDPGRYTYSEAGSTNWRVHFRGTAAHNTVCVDGLNQTRYEPKAIKEASRHGLNAVRHRIAGPAPDTRLLECVDGEAITLLHGRCASHAYDAVHERCIVFVDRGYWIVSDWLRAPTEHDYVLRFQLGAHRGAPFLALAQPPRAGQRTTTVEGWVSSLYGHKQAAPARCTHASAANADFDTVLQAGCDAAPALHVEDLAVRGEHGIATTALRILRDGAAVDGWFHARGAAAQRWQLGNDLVFSGRWLHWRLAEDGRLVRAVSHAGAALRDARGNAVPLIVEAGA